MDSQTTPLTGTQVSLVAGALLRQGFRWKVSRLELTFDVSGYSLAYLRQHLFTRTTNIRILRDSIRRETLYAGAPTSPWELCVYQKTNSVVRVEFKIRRAFLHERRIDQVQSLLRFRKIPIWDLVAFREFREKSLQAALRSRPDSWIKELVLESPSHWPVQLLCELVRRRLGIDPNTVLVTSEAEHVLRRMQRNLVW